MVCLHVAVTLLLAAPVSGQTYYLDGEQGDDAANGQSAEHAWKTLQPANATTFGPGDRLLLKAGTQFAGPLELHGSGAPGNPIVVGRYGEGPKPKVQNGPGGPPLVQLVNGEQWEVSDLELQGGRIGVFVYLKEYGIGHHLHFRNLDIHDVRGNLRGDDGGFLLKREGLETWFDDLLIEGCTIERVDRNGILHTDYPTAKDDHHSTRVVIRGNRLRDIGGDGIFILGCDGAVIEHNVLRYAHQRVGRRPGERACAGIWPHRCNDTLIQYNEVSHTAVGGQTVWDSEAFDDDIKCRGTIFQYNYSHDNAGGFLLSCGGSRGTIVRYNISQNDATATFTFESDGTGDALVHNNTVFVGEGMTVNFARNTAGQPTGVRFINNLLYAAGTLTYRFGGLQDVSFDHNLLFGNHTDPPAETGLLTADPKLIAPGGAGAGFDTAAAYALGPDSPCRGAGVALPINGGLDFFGHLVSADHPPSIGAHEPAE